MIYQLRCTIAFVLVTVAFSPLLFGQGWLRMFATSAATTAAPGELPHGVITDVSQSTAAIQDEFWQWAWGHPYLEDDVAMTLEAVVGQSGTYTVTATARDAQGEYLVGSATFQASNEYFLNNDTDEVVDNRTGVLWQGDLAGYVIPGTFVRADGAYRYYVGVMIENAVWTEEDENLIATGLSFVPALETGTLADAEGLALEIFTLASDAPQEMLNAVSMSQSGAYAQSGGGGGVIPCVVGGPVSCACQCLIDYNFNKAICGDDLRDWLVICTLGAIGAILACFLVCTAISPGAGPAAIAAWQLCMERCFTWLGGAVALCFVNAIKDYISCLVTAKNIYNRCLASCPP